MCYKKCQIEDYFNKILVFLLHYYTNSETFSCLYYLPLLLMYRAFQKGTVMVRENVP